MDGFKGRTPGGFEIRIGGWIGKEYALLPLILGNVLVPIPYVDEPAYITGTETAGNLLATIWGDDKKSIPLVTIGIARNSAESDQLWTSMHKSYSGPLATNADKPVATPWCAARLEAGIANMMSICDWVGDFERCLAWAFLESETTDQRDVKLH